MLAAGLYPDAWHTVIAGAPIADCVLQYEDEPAYFQAQNRALFRGTPRTAPQRYKRSSPLTYVNRVKASVLILYGKHDVRCPPRQVGRYTQRAKKHDVDITTIVHDSGHAGEFSNVRIRTKNCTAAIMFALKKSASHSRW